MICLPDGKLSKQDLDRYVISGDIVNDTVYTMKWDGELFIGEYCGTLQEHIERTGIYYDEQEERLRVVMGKDDPLSQILKNTPKDKIGKTIVPWNLKIKEFMYKDIGFNDLRKQYSDDDNVLTFIVKWLMNAADQDIDFWREYFESSLDFNNERRTLEEKGNISIEKFESWMKIFMLNFNLSIVKGPFDGTANEENDDVPFEVELRDDMNLFSRSIVNYIHELGYGTAYVRSLFDAMPNKRNNYITSLKGGKTRFESFLKWKKLLGFEYIIPIIENETVLCYYSSKHDTMKLPIR
jgi:hypothetical protein